MKKSKIILSSIFLALAGLSIAGSGLVYTEPTRVLATVNDDGTYSLGNIYKYNTQADMANYATLGEVKLYSEDEDETKSLYTYKVTNCSALADTGAITGSRSFGETIKLKTTLCSDISMRLPWLSHSFRISDNLLKASQNGYLSVSATAGVQMPESKKAHLKTVLYNGTLSDSDISDITSNAFTFNMQTLSTTTEASTHTVTLSNQSNSDYMLLFALNRDDGGTMSMTITQPTLTITSSDETAPSVEFTCDNAWKNTDKTLTIKVTDNESGIMSVVGANGEVLASTSGDGADDNHVKYYTMNIPENGDYSVVVTDNVGNSTTYTYTESHIDKTAPASPVITMPTLSFDRNITVALADFVASGSNEVVYYTIDGTTPTTLSNVLNIGDNTIEFPLGEDIKFRAIAIDEAGNTSAEYVSFVNVHNKYTINITATNCTYDYNQSSITHEGDGREYYDSEYCTLTFTANDGYQKRVIRINGKEFELTEDSYSFYATQDTTVEVIYVKTLYTLSYTASYVYDPSIEYLTPVFKLSEEGITPNIVITDNEGNEVASNQLHDAGGYTLSWSFYSYEFGGNGSFDFVINRRDVSISIDDGQYKVYGDEDPWLGFACTTTGLPSGVIPSIVISRDLGENAGTYAINIVSHNLSEKNYNVTLKNGTFTIRQRVLRITIGSFSKNYGDSDPEFTYSVLDGDIVNNDTVIYDFVRKTGEGVGDYEITKGNTNSNYQIACQDGKLTINRITIKVQIDNTSKVYGDNDPQFTYSVLEGNVIGDDTIIHTYSRATGESVDDYTITGESTNENYIVTIIDGKLTISRREIKVQIDNTSKVYGDSDPKFTYSVLEGNVIGEDSIIYTYNRATGEDCGNYDITCATSNDNYIITATSGVLTITQAELTITINDVYQVYGDIEKDCDYQIDGLKNNDDESIVNVSRDEGDDADRYNITCVLSSDNYTLDIAREGYYYITKATIIPTIIKSAQYIYSGTPHYVSSNFPYDLTFVYKCNGIDCDGMTDAGIYSVVAKFDGNKNYNASESETYLIEVEKQHVYLTFSSNQFIYDGYPHLPEYIYDQTCGLTASQIKFTYTGHEEDDEFMPSEVGEYHFDVESRNYNYEISQSGVLIIANSFSVVNANGSILECEEATFVNHSQDIMLVENYTKGKLNDEKIINTCTFENVAEGNDLIYTARVKSNSDSDKIHVYQLMSDNTIREIVVAKENGYYVFKVDNATDTYVITQEREPMPLWFWLVVMVSAIAVLIVVLQVVKASRKKKLEKATDSKDLDTYNIN